MKKLILLMGILSITIISRGQTDSIFTSESQSVIDLPKTIILADGSVISYKKWCRKFDKAARKGKRRILNKMKKQK